MKKLFLCFFLVVWVIFPNHAVQYPKTDNTVRIMSYNIRNARGLDNVTDYNRIADIINKVSPDVVALQELDSVTNRSKQVDVLSQLGDLTKMYTVYGASIPYDGGKYGIGILSKEKPLSWKRISLPGREEARSLLIAEFEQYIVCCTHFSLKAEDRRTSVEMIRHAVSSYDKPVFLAGDMNATPESDVFTSLSEDWIALNNLKQFTIPANEPRETIDYIFGYKQKGQVYSVHQARVLKEPVASDHLPLFVDVRLAAEKDKIFRTPAYLQNMSNDGVSVMWLTHVPCHSWVEYGTDSTDMRPVQSWEEGIAMANNTLNRIHLSGLKPGTRYYYRIYSREITLYQPYKKEFGNTVASKVASFKTWDDQNTDFTAVIFNDLHDRYALFDKLYEQVKNVPYDVVFFNGDCIADVQSEEAAVRSISHYSKGIGSQYIPSIYLRGNHENRGGYSMFLWNLLGKVSEHSYGSFNIGDTRFVLLDCGEDKPDDHWVYYGLNDFTQYRKDQADFLRKEVGSKEFKKASKRVLLHHIPIYGMGEKSFNPCLEYWGGILSKTPFNICLNAHMHRYRYMPKGEAGNNFPVIIGGGNQEKDATVMILQKKDKKMTLKVLNANGEEILNLDL
ncbi:MAG: endonuclease/exonuclease/phosphatase family protein [Bacteroidales bacterium]|nr:endonuclease/exonuclease/phosphatase family protein [Bacteroidales bacterium]